MCKKVSISMLEILKPRYTTQTRSAAFRQRCCPNLIQSIISRPGAGRILNSGKGPRVGSHSRDTAVTTTTTTGIGVAARQTMDYGTGGGEKTKEDALFCRQRGGFTLTLNPSGASLMVPAKGPLVPGHTDIKGCEEQQP